MDGLRNFRRLAERIVHPPLDFELHPQAEYSTKTFLDLLTHVATTHDFLENGSKTFKLLMGEGPSADDLLWHIEKLDWGEVMRRFTEALTQILSSAGPLGFSKRRRLDVAVDIHDWLYYGVDAPGVVRTKPNRGTSRAFKFISLSILKSGFRFVVCALPLRKQRGVVDELERLLRFAMQWIGIRRVYLDGEFYQVRVVRLLKQLGLKFVIRARVGKRLGKRMRRMKLPGVVHHRMMSAAGPEEVNLLVVKGRKGRQCFLTNIEVAGEDAERLADEFRKRWGIETSYRVMKDFRPRTASPNHVVRLFLFLFSVCLHDCWILANLVIGEAVLMFVPSKPFITAKMFGVVLYTPGLPFDPG
jgi:hypothetical protein